MSNLGEEGLGPQFLNIQDLHTELEFPLQLHLVCAEQAACDPFLSTTHTTNNQ